MSPSHFPPVWQATAHRSCRRRFTDPAKGESLCLIDYSHVSSLTTTFLQAEQERQAAVIRAEGEAEAAATISKALNRAGEAFVQFRRIEASKDIGEPSALSSLQHALIFRFLRSYLACWIEERDVPARG